MNLTTSLIQDITTFDGQDTSKLEDWLSDIETTADILKESCVCLAKDKSWGLAHNLVFKALQAHKSWDDIWDTLHLKLCNANIKIYTYHFMKTTKRKWKC